MVISFSYFITHQLLFYPPKRWVDTEVPFILILRSIFWLDISIIGWFLYLSRPGTTTLKFLLPRLGQSGSFQYFSPARNGLSVEMFVPPWFTTARLWGRTREGDRTLKNPWNIHVGSPVCTHSPPAPRPLLPLKASPQCCSPTLAPSMPRASAQSFVICYSPSHE